jgi:hypothetical protein
VNLHKLVVHNMRLLIRRGNSNDSIWVLDLKAAALRNVNLSDLESHIVMLDFCLHLTEMVLLTHSLFLSSPYVRITQME